MWVCAGIEQAAMVLQHVFWNRDCRDIHDVHGRVRCCSATPHLQGLQRHELPRTEAQMLVDRQRWDVDLDPSLCANAREKRDSRI